METNLLTKYRPQRFDDVVGQLEPIRRLRLYVQSPCATAMIFHGDSGVGKTATAIALASELGCAVEEEELGGLYNIPSGDMGADEVRERLRALWTRPLCGSGWKVLICNEADYMSKAAEVIWLDGLEKLPPKTVVVFTTNCLAKLSKRFSDRCEVYEFESATERLRPFIRQLVRKVWSAEGLVGACPAIDTLGLPTLTGADSMNASFRLALQQLQRYVRDAKFGNTQAYA